MKIVVVSDSHNFELHPNFPKIPGGSEDMLIHCGDLTHRGKPQEVVQAFKFWAALPHKYKIFIAGNHDFLAEENPTMWTSLWLDNWRTGMHYLQDQMIEVAGFKIYGSPYTPYFGGWAFNLHCGLPLESKYAQIPQGVDILITHGPAAGILDANLEGESCGSVELLGRIQQIKPKLHLSGHLHESRGLAKVGETLFVNASICQRAYNGKFNQPIVLEINPPAARPAEVPNDKT